MNTLGSIALLGSIIYLITWDAPCERGVCQMNYDGLSVFGYLLFLGAAFNIVFGFVLVVTERKK